MRWSQRYTPPSCLSRHRLSRDSVVVLWWVAQETLEDDGMARNDIRDAVRSFFPKRDCFTLVRPVTDEDKLADLSRVPYDDLREEFRFGVRVLAHVVAVHSGAVAFV